tara:strand:- start:103197 stop:104456 length:1260 start_codon:yes stop_codon:yes gene_type:complete
MEVSLIRNRLCKAQEFSFLLGVFFLPIYQTYNHWFLGIFLGVSFFVYIFNKDKRNLVLTYRIPLFIVFLLFLIKLTGLLHALNFSSGLKEVSRALPFFLYPIAIVTMSNKNLDHKFFEKRVFYALVLGCLVSAFICWGNVVSTLQPNDIPANQLFGWKKSGSYLTEILDLHPPYLGLLIVASLLFLLKQVFFEKEKSKLWYGIHILSSLILFLFLFNITARNALFYFILIIVSFIIIQKRWKLLIFPAILCVVFSIIIWKHPSQYYRLKMIDMLGFSKSDKVSDKRFVRLQASYNAFKLNPILGAGLGYDNELRMEQYKILNFEEAYKREHNSHNQFFEYLVSAGIIGGIVFVFVFLYFGYFLFKNRQWFYLILLINIFVSTLTESTFERVLGIQYFSILIGLSILAISSKQLDNGARK